MIVIWSLALLGILFKLTIAHRFKILSLVTYLTMGWLRRLSWSISWR